MKAIMLSCNLSKEIKPLSIDIHVMVGQNLLLESHQVTQVMLKVGDFMLNTWDLKWECLKILIKKLDFTHGIC